MSILGTILSIVPTVANVVGQLFDTGANNYIRFSMYCSNRNNTEGDIFFSRTDEGGIEIHNGCQFPIHVSMESADIEGCNDVIVHECSKKDITDMLAAHSAKYMNRIRISTNAGDSRENGGEIIAVTCSGKIDRDIEGSVQIGEYVSVEVLDNDLILIVHSNCVVKEISSLSIQGEGNEPARVYENITPGGKIPVVNSMIVSAESNDEVTMITFPNAVASFVYSDNLQVDVALQCELKIQNLKRLADEERRLRFESADWDFLRKGRCLNA